MKLVAAGAGAVTAPGMAFAAASAPLIYDGRFAAACAVAAGHTDAHDCAEDAASLWFARFAGQRLPIGGIAGFTTMADALVLGDCARRAGLRLALINGPADLEKSGLVHWHIHA